jgi:tetratricopeptide (TPR) repeat protein
VLYVGGSSFNPFLISKIKEKLVNAQSLVTHEPDKLVAEGAAVFSYFYYVHGLSLIKPITSDTIGIILKGNSFFPLIERGTQLPVKVTLPEFKLQSNLNDEVVVPVCINGSDYPIGEIRASLDGFYGNDETVTIEAAMTEDKIFELKVNIGDHFIGEGDFDNPFSIGKVSKEELELAQLQRKISKARLKNRKAEEKKLMRELITKHNDVGNNAGVVETCETYIRKFDDQDDWVWNMLYIGYSGMGRKSASVNALKKAIELAPGSASWIYNYSLVLERESDQKALDYLEGQPEPIKNDATVKCKIVLLKNQLNMDCKEEAKAITKEYKSGKYYFSDFDKQVLLPGIFRIAGEPFSYVKPETRKKQEDEKKYLVNKGGLTTL